MNTRGFSYGNWKHLRKAKINSKNNILAVVTVVILLLVLQTVFGATEEKEEVQELWFSRPANPRRLFLHALTSILASKKLKSKSLING